MGLGKSMLKLTILGIFVLGMSHPAMALLGNKFEKEVEKEKGAVKLAREVKRGGYGLITTAELKALMDSGFKGMFPLRACDMSSRVFSLSLGRRARMGR